MNNESKISPAFAPFLTHSGPNDKRDAIVIYQSPPLDEPRVRGRMRALKQRLKAVEERAVAQQSVQTKLFADYRKATSKALPGKQQLAASSIGKNNLPIAKIEVTPKTLAALAAQPDVVAVLPNQRIQLIKPKEVNYERLQSQENKDGLTWGLKQLGIPDLWKKTKGEYDELMLFSN